MHPTGHLKQGGGLTLQHPQDRVVAGPLMAFTIPGAPRTKKNHSRIVRAGSFPKVLPSKAFEEWNALAQVRLRKRENIRALTEIGLALPWAGPVNCRAVFYRERNTGDAVGYYQALADAIEEAGVLVNDSQIVSWDGSRMDKDARNPRIEVVLEALR